MDETEVKKFCFLTQKRTFIPEMERKYIEIDLYENRIEYSE